jgi:DNA-binding transcriptional LysR family regulator
MLFHKGPGAMGAVKEWTLRRPPALSDDSFDVCIRFGEPPDARVMARRLASNAAACIRTHSMKLSTLLPKRDRAQEQIRRNISCSKQPGHPRDQGRKYVTK